MASPTDITIKPPALHPGQREVLRRRRRFTTLACGRRWGKTRFGTALCLKYAADRKRAWWVAPTYKVARVGWRGIRSLVREMPGAQLSETDKLLTLANGGSVQVRSADDPDSLRGEGLDLAVIDEAAFVKESAWHESLRPALSDRKGSALFISTPKGRNWFWRQFITEDEQFKSFQFPTVSNPYIDPAEVEDARRHLPERIFQQEYLAEFLDDAGAVFRKIMDAIDRATPGSGSYVMGVDWGKHEDFTVLTVIEEHSGHVVAMDRFNQIDYAVQLGRLEPLVERYRPRVILAESNAMGEPLIEQLQRRGMPVESFATTQQSKAQIVEALALAFERGEVSIPSDDVLVNELQAYEMERLPSGKMRYNAPQGMHDDTVISLALAWWAHVSRPSWLIN